MDTRYHAGIVASIAFLSEFRVDVLHCSQHEDVACRLACLATLVKTDLWTSLDAPDSSWFGSAQAAMDRTGRYLALFDRFQPGVGADQAEVLSACKEYYDLWQKLYY